MKCVVVGKLFSFYDSIRVESNRLGKLLWRFYCALSKYTNYLDKRGIYDGISYDTQASRR